MAILLSEAIAAAGVIVTFSTATAALVFTGVQIIRTRKLNEVDVYREIVALWLKVNDLMLIHAKAFRTRSKIPLAADAHGEVAIDPRTYVVNQLFGAIDVMTKARARGVISEQDLAGYEITMAGAFAYEPIRTYWKDIAIHMFPSPVREFMACVEQRWQDDRPVDRRGRIILLNGASSAGKTSVGQALLPLLPSPWFLVSMDAISGMRSSVHTRALDDDEIPEMLTRTRRGYHRAVAALASAGNDVVMDYPLSEQWYLDDLLDVLHGYDVTLVEVRCPPEVLDRRERDRCDRPVGLANSQATVHAHGECDIAVNTTRADPRACAMAIADALDVVPAPKAFDRLRGRLTA